jgi:general secretion pathway protein G
MKARCRTALRGFTIIELLVVMAILGVLAAAVLPLGEMLITSRKERELRESLWEIRTAIDDYKRAVDAGAVQADQATGYPPTLKALVEGVPDVRPNAQGGRLYFLRRIPRDPFADPSLPAEKTWLLRSYASPPDKPAPGADVYDVRSSSTGQALDGSLYASW